MGCRALALLGLAACYAPQARDGIECGPGGECPSGQACATSTNTCERSALGPNDGAVDTRSIDACAAAPGMKQFDYSGMIETFVVPMCVTSLRVEAWGAAGGDGLSPTKVGGKGA